MSYITVHYNKFIVRYFHNSKPGGCICKQQISKPRRVDWPRFHYNFLFQPYLSQNPKFHQNRTMFYCFLPGINGFMSAVISSKRQSRTCAIRVVLISHPPTHVQSNDEAVGNLSGPQVLYEYFPVPIHNTQKFQYTIYM